MAHSGIAAADARQTDTPATTLPTAGYGDGPPDREGCREWKLSVSPVDRNNVAV